MTTLRQDSAHEIELYNWRQKALSVITTVTSFVAVPLFVFTLLTPHIKPSPPMMVGFGSACLCLCITAIFHRWPLHIRGVFWLLSGYLGGVVGFYRVGMAGSGRIFLLGMPVLALTILGKRAGFVSAGVSILIMLFFMALCPLGQMEQLLVIRHNPTELGFWIIQFVGWMLFMLPLMIVGEKFRGLQHRTLESAIEANQQLQAEIAERKRLEMDVLEISERERRHVGHDLHDGICQMLTGTLMRCQVYEKGLLREQERQEHFQTIREMIAESLDLSYELSRGLASGGNVQRLGLVEQIEEHVRKIPERFEIDCHLKVAGDIPAPSDQQTPQLLRIVQEAIHNSMKHASADKITIRLQWSSPYLELEIRDNGDGIPDCVDRRKTMGLRIMSYRAGIIGGDLLIEAPDDGGTRVVCRVPLGDAHLAK